MAIIQRVWGTFTTHPVLFYVAGGLLINSIRATTIAKVYSDNFAVLDGARLLEFEDYLASKGSDINDVVAVEVVPV